ncbi:hypothetical protein L208DRAFT_1294421 [Tricholoma matsutake]|nr:hypothetical protein L208DRAFT_1294421 [Tricholoma matsutake 945]
MEGQKLPGTVVNQHQSEGFGEYTDFRQKVLEAFSPINDAGMAKTEIKNLKQGSGNLKICCLHTSIHDKTIHTQRTISLLLTTNMDLAVELQH